MTNQRLVSIQILRGIAAMLVVFHHASHALGNHSKIIETGAIGVDIFFVISGFIMIYVSPAYVSGIKPPSDFMMRRIIRIYPMYALVTVAVLTIAFWHARHAGLWSYSLGEIAASFTFVPMFDHAGYVQPIMGVGWTLFYEMFFYVCFTAVLAFSRVGVIVPLASIFAGVNLTALMIGGKDAVSLFLQNTILYEFLFGCAIGGLFRSAVLKPLPSLLAIAVGLGGILLSLSIDFTDQARVLFWGIPCMFLVAGFIQLPPIRWPRPFLLVGDASYSIYLIHVPVVFEIAQHAPYVVTLISIAAMTGLLMFWFVERPVTIKLNRWLAGTSENYRSLPGQDPA